MGEKGPKVLNWNSFLTRFKEHPYSPGIVVVAEHLFVPGPNDGEVPPGTVALIPALAFCKRPKDGSEPTSLIVDYSHIVCYNDIHRRFVMSKDNLPPMYERKELNIRWTLGLAVGFLMLWDKVNDKTVHLNPLPGENNYRHWWDNWVNDPWYVWSNEDQDYTKLWTKGHTREEYKRLTKK